MGAQQALLEADAASMAGLPAFYTTQQLPELPFHVEGACGFRNQAVFHPRKWLLALAAAVVAPEGPGGGSYIAEHVRATGLREASTLPNRRVCMRGCFHGASLLRSADDAQMCDRAGTWC